MTSNTGFGKAKTAPKASKRTAQRADASKRYDKMKTEGIPEFEVYIRIKEKKAWYPVGAIAVKRSSQINRAIYANQEDLLQGAFRLFPVLRKQQTNLEYGYRLKEFPDEPIQLAIKPQSSGGKILQKVGWAIVDRLTYLFKRK